MFWSTITLNNRTNRFVCGPRYLTPQVCVINYLYIEVYVIPATQVLGTGINK